MENIDKRHNSKAMNIVGWILSIIPSLLLLMSGVMKFMPVTPEVEAGMQTIGWRPSQLTGLGILEIACVVIYLIPQTAVLGAILIAGYMGGAIATHARVGDAFYIQALIGVIVWLGLWLRDPRLRELLPIRK